MGWIDRFPHRIILIHPSPETPSSYLGGRDTFGWQNNQNHPAPQIPSSQISLNPPGRRRIIQLASQHINSKTEKKTSSLKVKGKSY
uniref:Uncharacterized protein n=1 Tax=Picea glauca TaxID=3330 RepID=A0A117NJD4_PICGL|nr:hypothetical protein ABT39_MTgene1227 [Picea glauca]